MRPSECFFAKEQFKNVIFTRFYTVFKVKVVIEFAISGFLKETWNLVWDQI